MAREPSRGGGAGTVSAAWPYAFSHAPNGRRDPRLNARTTLLALLALASGAALLFHLFQRQLSGTWFAFGVHPDVVAALERSRGDQKRLAELDPANEGAYREGFATTQQLLARLRVLDLSRDAIVRRYELALLAVFAAVLLGAAALAAWQQARQTRRLARLRTALAELAAGDEVTPGERRRDLIGRIAAMVEQASRLMASDRRRIASLENLSAWQEAARRHAHEMRTPLTALRLELERLRDLADEAGDPALRGELARLHGSLGEELARLVAFTAGFTSFARLQRPAPVRLDLGAFGREFTVAFAAAWPELALVPPPPGPPAEVDADPEMLRQVLANLADNSAQALREAGRRGRLRLAVSPLPAGFALDVADDGPGIAAALHGRLFAPYTTTRRIGEGMGLGLAISRKILLDHGGDLELLGSSTAGTTFRLVFPPPDRDAAEPAAPSAVEVA